MAKSKKNATPYERVKQILNEIQGDTIPEYQGYRAFWLSIDTFKVVELYGQRMISPPLTGGGSDEPAAPTGNGGCCGSSAASDEQDQAVEAVNPEPSVVGNPNCWPTGGSGGTGSSGGTKRSDQSGIIKGLLGVHPFDHSIFPPLLWDAARRATESEIKYIAHWIDAGCATEGDTVATETEKNSSTKVSVKNDEVMALACGEKAHRVSDKSTNNDQHFNKGLNVRKEVSTLTATELHRLRNALSCMYQYNDFWMDERSFDFWARMHANSCQHGWEQFLPWHRIYLYFFEQQLQDYDDLITLPYWAWSDYATANAETFNTKQLDLGIIPEAYRCCLTSAGYSYLADSGLFNDKELADLDKLAMAGTSYNSGLRFLKAADIAYGLQKNTSTGTAEWDDKTRVIYNVLRESNPLWFPNRWPGSLSSPSHYPTTANIELLLKIRDWGDFAGGPEQDHHFGKLEEVHNGMHNFAGGQNPHYGELNKTHPDPQNIENPPYGWMTDNRITAYDPIFWAHHANVDRLWARWQEMHSDVRPDDVDMVLAPWSLSVKDAMSTRKLGYEYMRDSFHYHTHSDVAITNFNSEKAGVAAQVLDNYRKAEIRLHRVQLGNKFNTTVRMFLNAPDACVDTSIENNAHYVGDITTFHGSCFGGPGHCNLPLDKTRKSDQRQLHHHEPRNYRIDATDAVNRMLAQGEEDISVHLVAVGLDGKSINEALYIDGVSLNFMD